MVFGAQAAAPAVSADCNAPSRFPCVPHRQYENMTQRDQMEDVVADVKT